MKNKQLKSFLVGLFVSVLVVASFFVGGLADRLFVIKPLDYVFKRTPLSPVSSTESGSGVTKLGRITTNGYNIPDIAQRASESVMTVSIRTQQRIIEPGSLFGPFGLFEQGETRVEEIQQDIGSGFVAQNNLIITNKHVVSTAQAEYFVIDNEGQEFEVTDIYRDPTLDLAILQVEDFSASALPLGDSNQVRVGERVIAIGTALGRFRHTVTTGVISGLGRSITASGPSGFENLENVIQTDAAINPGNSGGPLISSQGEVVGVNVATTGAENISFAIPINIVKAALENFEETGEFNRPMLGVRYSFITEQAAIANEVPQGAYIQNLLSGSSAEQAGLESGDIITRFDGERIDEENELAQLINQSQVGEQVTLEVWRDGQTREVQATLNSNQN